MAVIDVHTHMLNKDWLELLRRHGKPRRSISCQIGAKCGSVSERPLMLASTMTPTAP